MRYHLVSICSNCSFPDFPKQTRSTLKICLCCENLISSFFRYNVGDDLHIGIADSMTNVYSYWFNGISVESAGWCQSSVVYRFDDDDDMGFDSLLSSFVSFDASRFEGELYDCTKWNCFDFVMEFMRFINFRNYSKTDFVSEFVQSALGNIVKYKSLLRRVEENGHILL